MRWQSPGHSGNKHPFRACGHETTKRVAALRGVCAPSCCVNKRGVAERLLGRVHGLLNSCFKKRYVNPRALNSKHFGKMYAAVLNHRCLRCVCMETLEDALCFLAKAVYISG